MGPGQDELYGDDEIVSTAEITRLRAALAAREVEVMELRAALCSAVNAKAALRALVELRRHARELRDGKPYCNHCRKDVCAPGCPWLRAEELLRP